jgi:type III restriction enzyme
VGFRLDYVKADGDLSTYTPDFIVRTAEGRVFIIETKGREELDLPQKMARLRQWCADATAASQETGGPAYGFVYVDQLGFERNTPKSFAALAASFTDFKAA